jgi:hypothetical protein
MNTRDFCLTIILLCSVPVEISSQGDEICPYFGISADHFLLAGSFNGTDYFQTDDHIVLVPSIKPSFGFGGVIGIGSSKIALDIGYHMTRSTYSSMDENYTGNCVVHLVRFLGFTMFFDKYAEGTVRPYIDLDFSIAWHIFDKIAYPMDNPEDPNPANFGAIMLGLGAGTQVKLSDQLALDIRILPEYAVGTSIRVKGYKYYEIKKFGNFFLLSSVGIKYCFKST